MASTTLLKQAAERQAEIDDAVANYLANGGKVTPLDAMTQQQSKDHFYSVKREYVAKEKQRAKLKAQRMRAIREAATRVR